MMTSENLKNWVDNLNDENVFEQINNIWIGKFYILHIESFSLLISLS